ncbi:putative kinesin [Trypanosoma cruzi]|nr:putative kinesin [Trypanosoma cruzi]
MHRHDATQNITPSNLGTNNHRAFALLLRGGKSLEVVCETGSDCEAWLVALKRPLHLRTPAERLLRNDGVREETHVRSRAIMTWKCGGVAHLTPAICEDLFCWPRCSNSLRRASHSAGFLPSGRTGAG